MTNPNPLQRCGLLAAMLALASAPALAGGSLAALAYAGGEALSPEAEARLVALITTPGGGLSRDEVRQQLAAAQREGTLAEAGEIAETPQVLLARNAAGERQAREVMAAHEMERARLAAIEAEAAAAAEAQQQARLQAKAAATESRAVVAAGGATGADAAATPATAGVMTAPAPAAPPDEPADRPSDRPAVAPLEVPITRPTDLPAETLVDED